PSWHDDGRPATAGLRRLLTREHDHGATVVGLCLGTFPLAEAGLLTGRRVVTHWHAFDLLAELHPSLSVDEAVLYIDHGEVLTAPALRAGRLPSHRKDPPRRVCGESHRPQSRHRPTPRWRAGAVHPASAAGRRRRRSDH